MILIALGELWNLLAGYAGIYSFGQQAYVGIGAYTTFAVADLVGLNLWIALVLSAAVGGTDCSADRSPGVPSSWRILRGGDLGDSRDLSPDRQEQRRPSFPVGRRSRCGHSRFWVRTGSKSSTGWRSRSEWGPSSGRCSSSGHVSGWR